MSTVVRRFPQALTVTIVIIVAALCGLLASQASTSSDVWKFWLGAVLFVVCGALAVRRFAARGEQLMPMSLLTIFLILEFVAGGIFYREPRVDSVVAGIQEAYTTESMSSVLLLAFVAWVALLVGYRVLSVGQVARRIPRPRIEDNELVAVAVVLWVVGLLARFETIRSGYYFHFETSGDVLASSTLRQILAIGAMLPLIAMGLLQCAYYRGRVHVGIAAAVVIGELAWAAPSGERSRLVGVLVALMVVRFFGSDKPFPVRKTLLGLAVVVLVIFPFGAIYRGSAYGSRGFSTFQADPVQNIERTMGELASHPDALPKLGFEETVRRFSGSTSIAAINHSGRQRYPTSPGRAIETWIGAAIPRALMPGKSDPSVIPNEFGRSYDILYKRVRNSSIAMTTVGDLYGTFGFLPMLAGMFLIGGIVRGIAGYFFDLRASPASLAIYATMITGLLIGFETTVALGILTSLRETFVYVVATWGALALMRMIRRSDVPTR